MLERCLYRNDSQTIYTLDFMNYYKSAIEFTPLYKAMKKCCKNLRWKDSVTGYEGNGLKNTYRLRQDLLNGTYKIGKYQRFVIYEPKKRDIVATRFRDRQVQMALCKGGVYHDITEHFITDNPACQIGKGTDYTLDRLTAHLRRYYNKHGTEGWVLKADIHHFFPETRHDVAKETLAKYIDDKQVLEHLQTIIDSFDGDKGIGLGSQVSQLVELAMLNELDHYIKEQLHIKYYVRYMDDMVLIDPDKEHLKYCLEEIKKHLATIGFELNSKTTIYPLHNGVKLMNWRYKLTETGKVLRLMSKSKLGKQRRKMKRLFAKEMRGEVEKGTTKVSLESWLANAKRGDTFHQRQRMIEYYRKLEKEYDNPQQGIGKQKNRSKSSRK